MKNFKDKALSILIILALAGGFLYDIHLMFTRANASYSPTSGTISPYWVKITKSYTDFSTAATTNTITVYTLPAKGVVTGCQMNPTTVFSGGLIATYTIKIDQGATAQCVATNVFTGATFTPSSTSLMTISSLSGTTNITATSVSTVGNLSAATQGSVDIYLLISVLP